MNDNITDLNIRNNSVRCAWSDEVFTIIKVVGRENRTLTLTPEEEDYLYEQLTIKRMPWGTAS